MFVFNQFINQYLKPMKKVLLLSLSICFLISVTALASVTNFEIKKEQTEKVSFENPVVFEVNTKTIEAKAIVSKSIVQRQCDAVTKKKEYASDNLKKQSFNSNRYWCRNFSHSSIVLKEICSDKFDKPLPQKDRKA